VLATRIPAAAKANTRTSTLNPLALVVEDVDLKTMLGTPGWAMKTHTATALEDITKRRS